MKKIIFLAIPFLLSSVVGKTQCRGNVVYYAGKMEMLDSGLNVRDSKEITATVSTSDTRIMVRASEMESDTMAGVIKKTTCNWRQPYKNGKTIIIADIKERQDLLKDAVITIEAVDGKITILLHAAEHPDNLIRLFVDKYEEASKK